MVSSSSSVFGLWRTSASRVRSAKTTYAGTEAARAVRTLHSRSRSRSSSSAIGSTSRTPSRSRRARTLCTLSAATTPAVVGSSDDSRSLQERRRPALHRPGAEAAIVGPAEVQLVACPGHGHVEEPTLLRDGVGRESVRDGHQAVLEPGDVDHGPFEALGGMEGHDRHRVRARLGAIGPTHRPQGRHEIGDGGIGCERRVVLGQAQ